MLPGCLIDDPPPYAAPKQTPPRLSYSDALPLLSEVIVARTGDTLTFRVPTSSEDAGEGLNAFLIRDYQGGDVNSVAGAFLEPSSLEDTQRPALEFSWHVIGVPPGCHRLTLRVAHVSTLPNAYAPVTNQADLAEAYWWMNLDVDPALGNALVNCPLASTGTRQ